MIANFFITMVQTMLIDLRLNSVTLIPSSVRSSLHFSSSSIPSETQHSSRHRDTLCIFSTSQPATKTIKLYPSIQDTFRKISNKQKNKRGHCPHNLHLLKTQISSKIAHDSAFKKISLCLSSKSSFGPWVTF